MDKFLLTFNEPLDQFASNSDWGTWLTSWGFKLVNYIFDLDPAVLRPGRLDKVLYVGFPGPQDRVEILNALTKNGTKPKLGNTHKTNNHLMFYIMKSEKIILSKRILI